MPPDTTHHENSGADEPNKAPLRTTLAGGLSAPIPVDEQARLAALRRYDLSDPATKASLEELCALAAAICQVPLAFVSLVEEAREVFAVAVGSDEADSPRDISFCGHAIVQNEELFVVPDTHTDPRFAKNPNVLGGARIRFYAGTPLRTRDGFAIGALCVKDTAPRELGPQQLDALTVLGRQVVAQLERKSDEMLARSRRSWMPTRTRSSAWTGTASC